MLKLLNISSKEMMNIIFYSIITFDFPPTACQIAQ